VTVTVTVTQVSFGNSINYGEVRSVASEPADSNVVVFNDFAALADAKRVHVARLLCNSQSLAIGSSQPVSIDTKLSLSEIHECHWSESRHNVDKEFCYRS